LIEEREQLRARPPQMQAKSFEAAIPRKIVMTFAANLLISTIAWWLESGTQYSPQQITTWFLTLAIYGYVHALGL
jgi:hypothetical protein